MSSAFAQQLAGIEPAAARIVDDAVRHTVNRIARGDRRLGDQGQFRSGQRTSGFERPHRTRHEMDPVVSRVARDEAVIVGWKSLRLRQRLLSSRGAAGEVGVLRQATIVVAHDQFGRLGHDVDRPKRPVIDFVRVADAEGQIVRYMSGVRARSGVAAVQRIGHRRVTQRSGKPTVACPFEIYVPVGGSRHPEFEMNFRIVCRSQHGHHSAEFRQVDGSGGSRRRKRPG